MVLNDGWLELLVEYKMGDCGLLAFCVKTGNGERISPWCVFSLEHSAKAAFFYEVYGSLAMHQFHQEVLGKLYCVTKAISFAADYGVDQPISMVSDAPIKGVSY